MSTDNNTHQWMSLDDACDLLSVSDRTLRRMVNRGDVLRRKQGRYSVYKLVSTPDSNIIAPSSILQPTTTELRLAKREHLNNAEQFLSELNDIYTSRKDRTSNPNINALLDSQSESLCILLSDLHIGKASTGYKIINERILSITDKILPLVDAHDIDEVVLLLIGDMVEGEDIFPHQAHQLDLPVLDQIKFATRSIWNLATDIVCTYDIPVRMETCPGNHGRVSRTANPRTNWDNIVYQTLGEVVEAYHTQDIIIYPNYSRMNLFEVKDKTGLMIHDGPRHMGTPAMKLRVAGWREDMDWDFLVYGHWHNWAVETIFGHPCIRNGTIANISGYEANAGYNHRPRQGWLIVTPDQPLDKFGFFQW